MLIISLTTMSQILPLSLAISRAVPGSKLGSVGQSVVIAWIGGRGVAGTEESVRVSKKGNSTLDFSPQTTQEILKQH